MEKWIRIFSTCVFTLLLLLLMPAKQNLFAQELYVFTEPASNMPVGSLMLKYEAKLLKG